MPAPRYVALTTQNAKRDGWTIIAVGALGETRDVVRERAERVITEDFFPGWEQDTAIQTDMKNLQVLYYSVTRRAYPSAWRRLQAEIESHAAEMLSIPF